MRGQNFIKWPPDWLNLDFNFIIKNTKLKRMRRRVAYHQARHGQSKIQSLGNVLTGKVKELNKWMFMSSRLKLKQAKGPFYVREETISWIPLTSWMKMKAGLCLQHCWQGLQTEIWWYFITTLSSLRDEARAFHYIEDDGLFLRVVPYYTDTHKNNIKSSKNNCVPKTVFARYLFG